MTAYEIDQMVNPQEVNNVLALVKGVNSLDTSLSNLQKNTKTIKDNIDSISTSTNSTNEKLNDYNKTLSQSAANAKQLDTQQKQLITTDAKLATANSTINKELTKKKIALQQTNKLSKDEAILNDKNSGTLEKLAAKNRILEQAKKKLNLETKTGKKALKAINKEQDKNNKLISTANNKNQERIGGIGLYGKAFDGLKNGFTKLMASPVVLFLAGIAIALKQLKDAFSSSDRGRELMAKGLGALKGIGQIIFNLFSKLTEVLIDVFEDPKKSLNDLGEAIKTNLINRLLAFVEIGKAAGKILKGIWERDLNGIKEGAKDAGSAMIQMGTGLDKMQQQNVIGALNGQLEESSDLIRESIKLEERELKLRINKINFITKEAELNKTISELRKDASDQTLDAEVRLKAIADIETNINTLIDEQSKIKREELSILATKNSLGKNTLEDTEKERILQADLIKLDEQRASEQRTLIRLRSRALDQLADKAVNDSLEEQQTLMDGVTKKLLEGTINANEYKEAQRNVAIEGIQLQIDAIDKVVSSTETTEAKRIMLSRQRSNLERQLSSKQVDDYLKDREKEAEIEKAYIDASIAESERKYARERMLIEASGMNESEKARAVFDLDNRVIQNQIDNIDVLLQSEKDGSLEWLSLKEEQAELQLDLDNLTTDNELENIARKKAAQEELINAGIALTEQFFAFRSAKLSAEMEELDYAREKELENDKLTTEEKEKIEEKYAKKKFELELKQAKAERTQALFGIAVNTAMAVAKVWGQTGVGGIVAQIAPIAMGALQAATVLAKPLPKFAKGEKHGTPESFIAGEAGRELLTMPTGQMLMVNQETVFSGKEFKGSKIKSNPETEKYISDYTSHGGFSKPIKSDDRLIGEVKGLRKDIRTMQQPVYDKDGRVTGMISKTRRENYLEKMRL